jgi:glc operon protein GlcG
LKRLDACGTIGAPGGIQRPQQQEKEIFMTRRIVFVFIAAVVCATVGAGTVSAQLREKKAVTLAGARKMAAAAEAEAIKNKLTVTVAIADDGGNLIYLERMDGAPFNTMEVTVMKARTSAGFGQPTRFFEDQIAHGGEGTAFLSLPQVVAKAGAFPILIDGQVAGSISVGGAMDDLDDQCARAGLAALEK